MATIALYANQINRMPGMFTDAKRTVTDYKTELSALKNKALTIHKSVCNLDDIINSIKSSSRIQEQKETSLETWKQNSENFTEDTDRIDSKVADVVNQRKNNFYDKYSYLKPECEKSWKEKAREWLTAAGEWCKEHWVTIVTVAVVVLVAALALVCGVAIACIAAVAGMVALVICTADLICMAATGGKTIADVLREKGLHVLADIFQGVSIGADIVSIVFPVGAALKTMAKVGVKTFVKTSVSAVKTAFKETIEKVFQSGFKNGIKNLKTIAFKTFIIDFDDFKNWKTASRIPGANKHWTNAGDKLIPSAGTVPGLSNPDGLTMEGIMKKHGYDSIPLLKNGSPDISKISLIDVDISMKNLDMDVEKVLSGEIDTKKFERLLRDHNFANADLQLKTAFDNNMADYATKNDYEKAKGYQLTWHEDSSMKKCWLVPTEIHANIRHIGGIANYKFNFKGIPNQISQILEKISQKGFRMALD